MRAPKELFFGDLRKRWIEYALGAVVIAVVSGPLVLQRSVTASAESKVHDLAHHLGKNMLVMPQASEPADFHMLRYDDGAMPQDYPERIRKSALGQHVKVVHARLNGNVEVRGVSLILVGDDGQRGSTAANMSVAPVVELGPEAAESLGMGTGDEIEIRGLSVRIVGVRDPPPQGLGMGVFTSLNTAQEILDRPGEINSMRLGGCWCRLDVPELAADVEKLLPGTRGITVAGVLKAQKGTVSTMKRYSLALYLVGLLLVGGTVLALISSQIRRSLREIGLLLAVGASTTTILVLVIVKAALVGFVGGLLGYLLGVPLTTQIGSRILQLPLAPPPDLWLPVVGLCLLVSVVAASVPAWRAARLDPTVVLRED